MAKFAVVATYEISSEKLEEFLPLLFATGASRTSLARCASKCSSPTGT